MKENMKFRILSISIGLIFFYFGFLKFISQATLSEQKSTRSQGFSIIQGFNMSNKLNKYIKQLLRRTQHFKKV